MPADERATYLAENINNEKIQITGTGANPLWEKAKCLSTFVYPWENKTSSTTSFKALHNNTSLYCLFEVQAEEIKVFVDKNDKLEVIKSERVEIFFRKDEALTPYYCLELDPNGRVLDYEAEYYRKFNMSWSWPSGGLKVKASRTKAGYSVEVEIGKESLLELGILKGQKIEAGIFRADCVSLVNGEATMSWISWVKPNAATPDFHIPSSFGTLLLG